MKVWHQAQLASVLQPTPQCRDGNRTAVLIGYTKGGENFETEVLARVTMPIEDFGLE